jgi:hypothetical protein
VFEVYAYRSKNVLIVRVFSRNVRYTRIPVLYAFWPVPPSPPDVLVKCRQGARFSWQRSSYTRLSAQHHFVLTMDNFLTRRRTPAGVVPVASTSSRQSTCLTVMVMTALSRLTATMSDHCKPESPPPDLLSARVL